MLLAQAASLDFTPPQIVTVIVVCALTALISHMALGVFNDGVRPFLLDFIRGETTRAEMTAISFGLSAGFIFGLGAPIAFSTGVLNPWLLFLPTDILGILAPRRWLAPLLGAAWGALVVFGLGAANRAAQTLPVDFLTAMQQMATPILYLFTLFPAIAISDQFGRLRGGITFVVQILIVAVTLRFAPDIFPGALAMAAGVLLLLAFALTKDLGERRQLARSRAAESSAAGDDGGSGAGVGGSSAAVESEPEDDPMASLFGASAARLRRNIVWYMALGAAIAVLTNLKIFAGGEATSFVIAEQTRQAYTTAAQVDFYRAFGFIPLIATTALASGAYQIVGFTFVYPLAYLSPNAGVAAIGGAVLFAVEILALSYIGRGLATLPSIRDASDHLRNAITTTLGLAILFGSILAGSTMAGGLGIALVGGLYLLNEALGRPIVRLAAGPVAVVLAGIVLNVLYWLQLFTPPEAG